MAQTQNNLRFLVTGGAGFIGSEIVRQLLDRGFMVRVADNLSKKDTRLDPRAEFLKVDLTNRQAASDAFVGIDIVIAAAAKIGGIGYFHKYPAAILSENNKIYSTTFEEAVKNKIKRLVYISSSMVFESAVRFPSKEDDINRIPPPLTAYGFSKLTGEWYCHAFHDQYQLTYTICRPFNAYGTGEFPEREIGVAHVIPDLVRKVMHGQYPLQLLGDGNQIRCFTHVSDIADGIITSALSKNGQNQDFNIGSDVEIKMIDLAKKIWMAMEVKKPFRVKFAKPFKYDIKRRVPNVQKAKKMLNWEPQVKFEDGLLEVITWLGKQKATGKLEP
ncbi:MAG: NAD-dependent epimerase/dehydratase family protein [Patescibacteria group bacterium]